MSRRVHGHPGAVPSPAFAGTAVVDRGKGMEFIWGAVLVASGIFIAVYGNVLFRFVLAVLGFAAGFMGAMTLLDGRDDALQLLVSMVVGGIAAAVLFALVKFGLYIAGSILGGVIALVVSSLIGQLDGGVNTLAAILLVAGAGTGGFFGHRLGNLVIVLATATAGAFLTVYGLTIWFQDELSAAVEDPSMALTRSIGITLFLCIAAISGLAQINSSNLRFRLLH
jgi:hypothetical protein